MSRYSWHRQPPNRGRSVRLGWHWDPASDAHSVPLTVFERAEVPQSRPVEPRPHNLRHPGRRDRAPAAMNGEVG
jgi:hypothetical protein